MKKIIIIPLLFTIAFAKEDIDINIVLKALIKKVYSLEEKINEIENKKVKKDEKLKIVKVIKEKEIVKGKKYFEVLDTKGLGIANSDFIKRFQNKAIKMSMHLVLLPKSLDLKNLKYCYEELAIKKDNNYYCYTSLGNLGKFKIKKDFGSIVLWKEK